MRLPGALVADANVILSASIGGRAAIVLGHEDAPIVHAAVEVHDEVSEWLPRLSAKRGLDADLRLAIFHSLPVHWTPAAVYRSFEKEARSRMRERDEDDWPSVALALALGGTDAVAVWTQDHDYAASGLRVLTTGQQLDLLLDAGV